MVRKAPQQSSKQFELGTIKTGLDKHKWIVVSKNGGGKRWKSLEKIDQNGGWFGRIQLGPIIWGDKVCRMENNKINCHTTWKIDWNWFYGK